MTAIVQFDQPPPEVRSRLKMPASARARGISPAQWRVLVETTFPSAKTAEAVEMAFDYCAARRLDVFKKPVHIVPMWNSSLRQEVETIWPGISEIQTTASRTREWVGMDSPKWGPDITKTFEGETKQGQKKITLTFPEWCEVTVWRLIHGTRCPFTEPVFWMEAFSTQGRSGLPNDMWQKRPRGQLHKVAKAAALRAAFPEEGEYAAEEMEGKEIEAGGVAIEHQAPLVALPAPEPERLSGSQVLRVEKPVAVPLWERERYRLPTKKGGQTMPLADWAAMLEKAADAAPSWKAWVKLLDDNLAMVEALQTSPDHAGLIPSLDGKLQEKFLRPDDDVSGEPAPEAEPTIPV